jgi:hypothetical protein
MRRAHKNTFRTLKSKKNIIQETVRSTFVFSDYFPYNIGTKIIRFLQMTL